MRAFSWIPEKPLSIVAVILGAFVIWQGGVQLFHMPLFLLPSPENILEAFLDSPRYFLTNAAYTAWTTLLGFALAVSIGILLAVGIVYSVFLERTLYTLLIALNSIPKVALAPLFVVWMGTGAAPKIAIAMTIAIFSVVINTVLGLRSVDTDLLSLASSTGTSEVRILWKIRLPHALPSIFSGMKIAISVALIGAIVGEFVAGSNGLGHVILLAQGTFQSARMFVAIVLLGVLGTIMFYAVELGERLSIPWHISQRFSGEVSPGFAIVR